MKKAGIYTLFLILYSFLFFSCKKEHETINAPSGFDYMPTNASHWVVYDVDSVVHADNDGETDDSVRYYHFQVKEVIGSTFIDGEGRPAQRIERYKRTKAGEEWVITNIWSSTVTAARAERAEDNIRYIPLAFPINSTNTWNGNAFNTLGEQEYSYESFHESIDIGDLTFDSALTVVRNEQDNFVERLISKEKYAVHVGRIYKVDQNFLKTGGQVVSGLDYRETIVDYGN